MQPFMLSVQEIVSWLKNVTNNHQTNLVSDSRRIQIGDIFFAYFVNNINEWYYIIHALKRGAAAIVHEKNNYIGKHKYKDIPCISVRRLKNLAGFIANAYYNEPDKTMFTVAVTGTNGKTSCAYWLGLALSRLETSTALTAVIGTLGIGFFLNGKLQQNFDLTGYTTPDAMLLQRKLVDLRTLNTSMLIIEASSIGLHQGRMNGLHIDIALFTNFTRDHLDYHGDMFSYAAAKIKLFNVPKLQYAIINLDDKLGQRLFSYVKTKGVITIGYTLNNVNFYNIPIIRAFALCSTNSGTNFYIHSPYGTRLVKTQLIGQFNISNILGVLGVLLARGIDLDSALTSISMLTPVPGRMQQFSDDKAVPLIIIDYAHTPDALEKTLIELRQLAIHRHGKLWCIFGCGGDRDVGKRSQMGAISELADHVILTNDNPRNEDPSIIISDIRSGMHKIIPRVIKDRATAIFWTVQHANKQDVILLAGKGHEKYQEIAGKKFPFLDADYAKVALASRTNIIRNSV